MAVETKRVQFGATKEKKINIKRLFQGKKGKINIIGVIAGISIMVLSPQIAGAIGTALVGTVGVIAGLMIMIVPFLMNQISESKRRENIDANLPIFLLSLVSSIESGLSLMRAVEESANRQLGALTPELKNLRANISWGMPHHEAFDVFTKKVGTRLSKRVAVLLQISMDIGGNVTDTLELIHTHVTEMQNVEKERKSQLSPYIYTIYISFVVFLSVSILLVANFFTEIENVQEQLRVAAAESNIPLGMFGSILGVEVDAITGLMFNMSIIEAVFGGIAAGKIGEGSFPAGIKHVIAMVVLTVIGFAAMGAF
ncbi:MAG: type II secretion system F family protein [Nitrosopumilaceae archaeon]|nr:type II secretion system F family protein [Nitrosopumilaceae archaeon]